MDLKKEEVYIDLRGMSKEELTKLYWLLKNNIEEMYRGDLNNFLDYPNQCKLFHFYCNVWCGYYDCEIPNKTQVTITELKEILEPTNTLQQKLEKAKAEVERLEELINEPNAGDWALLWDEGEETPLYGKITHYNGYYHTCNGVWDYGRKVTNEQLIQLLENESKN